MGRRVLNHFLYTLLLFRSLLLAAKFFLEIAQFGNTEEVICHNSNEDIESDEGEDNAKVPPALRVVDAAAREELVCVGETAELAA